MSDFMVALNTLSLMITTTYDYEMAHKNTPIEVAHGTGNLLILRANGDIPKT